MTSVSKSSITFEAISLNFGFVTTTPGGGHGGGDCYSSTFFFPVKYDFNREAMLLLLETEAPRAWLFLMSELPLFELSCFIVALKGLVSSPSLFRFV